MSISQAAIRAGEAYIEIRADSKRAQEHIRTLAQKIHAFGDKISENGGNMMRLGMYLAQPAVYAVKKYAEFDDTMRSVQAISSATAKEMEGLTEQAKTLGKTTAFTAQQVGGGMTSLQRMGFNAREIAQAIHPMMNMVRATGTEMFRLGELSDYQASVMRTFQMEASKVTDIADLMSYQANNSATDIADMGQAMKIVSPTAYSFGESAKDVAQALMVLANAGVRGSLAGTALRKLYSSLATAKGITTLKDLGVEAIDPKTKDLRKVADIMVDLAVQMKDMKRYQKYSMTEDIFDLRGSLGALTILNNPDSLRGFRRNLDNIKGYAMKTSESIESGIGGIIRGLVSRIEDAVISYGQQSAGSLEKFKDNLYSKIESISGFINRHTKLVNNAVKISAYLVLNGAVSKLFGYQIKNISVIVGLLQKTGKYVKKAWGFFGFLYKANLKHHALVMKIIAHLGVYAGILAGIAQVAAAVQVAIHKTNEEINAIAESNKAYTDDLGRSMSYIQSKGQKKLAWIGELSALQKKSEHAKLSADELTRAMKLMDNLGIQNSVFDSYDILISKIRKQAEMQGEYRQSVIDSQLAEIDRQKNLLLMKSKESNQRYAKTETGFWGIFGRTFDPFDLFHEDTEDVVNDINKPLLEQLNKLRAMKNQILGIGKQGENSDLTQDNANPVRNMGLLDNSVQKASERVKSNAEAVGSWSLAELQQNAGNAVSERIASNTEKSASYLGKLCNYGKTITNQFVTLMEYT